MSRGTLDSAVWLEFSATGLSPSLAGLSKTVPLTLIITYAVRTPQCTHRGLGSFAFARRYSQNRCFFLFLRLLRCFSSPGSLPYVMDWRMDTYSLCTWVSPFRYLRIKAYLQLPEAFRSLSRLSSALSAKASTLRSFLLDLFRCIALHHFCLNLAVDCFLELIKTFVSTSWFVILGCLEYYFRRPSVAQMIFSFRGKLAFLRKRKIRCITESRLSERTCSRARDSQQMVFEYFINYLSVWSFQGTFDCFISH